MKHLYYLLFVILLLPIFTFAQSNYKPGYVVTLRGDTLRGVIDYKEWDENPKEIRFKNSLNPDKVESLSAANTAAFSINGAEFYQRFILPVSQDQVEITRLALKLDTAYLTDTVFLRVNSTGKHVTLYSYTDNIKKRFYILNADETQPAELIYHAYYDPSVSSVVQYINRYRSQLQFLAQKYNVSSNSFQQRILQANYTEPDLVKIVQTINGNTSQQFSSNSLSGSRWFAGAGVNFADLKFKTINGTTGASTVTDGNSVFPLVTAGVDFFPNKATQGLFVRIELFLTMDQLNFSTSNQGEPPSTSTLNVKQFNSALAPQLFYNFYNTDQLKVFLGVGAAFTFSTYNHYAYITKYSDFPDMVQANYPSLSSFWVSFPIKAGITINNKIEVSICYVPSSSLTTNSISSINASSFQAGFNYLFK